MPEHATAVGQTVARTTQYLNSLRPDTTPKNPLDSKIPPSKIQTAAFNRALDIANQPLIVLKEIKDGSITPESVKNLVSLYPDLYKKLVGTLTSEMMSHLSKDEAVPYNTRIGLSLFLGQPMDSTLTPMGIVGAQPMPPSPMPQAQGSQSPGEGQKHSMASLSKLPGSYQTQSQANQTKKLTS